MPALSVPVVTQTHKSYSSHLSPGAEEALEYCMEAVYLVASVIFVIGSVALWPEFGHVRAGCRLFDAGAVMFFAVALCNAAELRWRPKERPLEAMEAQVGGGARVLCDVRAVRRACKMSGLADATELYLSLAGRWADIVDEDPANLRVRCKVDRHVLWLPVCMLTRSKATPRGREILEQALYVVGSFIFTVGTVIWDPDFAGFFSLEFTGRTRTWWLCLANGLFMLGSFIFGMAAYVNALAIYETNYNKVLRGYSLATATCYEFGAFCFIAGTMGFAPNQLVGCNKQMEALGCLFYIVGSMLYLIGSGLSFCKTIVHHQMAREHAEKVTFLQRWAKKRLEQKKRQQDENEDGLHVQVSDAMLPERKEFLKSKEAAVTIQRRFAQMKMDKVSQQVKETLQCVAAERRHRRQSSERLGVHVADDDDVEEMEICRRVTSRVFETLADQEHDPFCLSSRSASNWDLLCPLLGDDGDEEVGAWRNHEDDDHTDFWSVLKRAFSCRALDQRMSLASTLDAEEKRQ